MLKHNRMKKVREKKGMKQSDVCRGIVSASHYSNIEACRFTPPIDTIMLIAERLDVPYTYLLNTHSYSAELEELLLEYENLIEKRDVYRIDQLLKKSDNNLKYIESIEQEHHFYLLKFLDLVMRNNLEKAITHYEENSTVIKTDLLNLNIYKIHIYSLGLYSYLKKDFKESIKYYFKKMKWIKLLKASYITIFHYAIISKTYILMRYFMPNQQKIFI